MQLTGMMDSPYVRRVAISLALYDVTFDSLPLSVFSSFDRFAAINPLVKAPTLVLDDGTRLMDSTLIIHYFESLAPTERKQLPAEPGALATALSLLGTLLVASEKAVQRVYEQQLRPQEKQHQPWLDRVTGQLLSACTLWQQQMTAHPAHFASTGQVAITSAVVWSFIQLMLPEVVSAGRFPAIAAQAQRMEALPAFMRYPQQ